MAVPPDASVNFSSWLAAIQGRVHALRSHAEAASPQQHIYHDQLTEIITIILKPPNNEVITQQDVDLVTSLGGVYRLTKTVKEGNASWLSSVKAEPMVNEAMLYAVRLLFEWQRHRVRPVDTRASKAEFDHRCKRLEEKTRDLFTTWDQNLRLATNEQGRQLQYQASSTSTRVPIQQHTNNSGTSIHPSASSRRHGTATPDLGSVNASQASSSASARTPMPEDANKFKPSVYTLSNSERTGTVALVPASLGNAQPRSLYSRTPMPEGVNKFKPSVYTLPNSDRTGAATPPPAGLNSPQPRSNYGRTPMQEDTNKVNTPVYTTSRPTRPVGVTSDPASVNFSSFLPYGSPDRPTRRQGLLQDNIGHLHSTPSPATAGNTLPFQSPTPGSLKRARSPLSQSPQAGEYSPYRKLRREIEPLPVTASLESNHKQPTSLPLGQTVINTGLVPPSVNFADEAAFVRAARNLLNGVGGDTESEKSSKSHEVSKGPVISLQQEIIQLAQRYGVCEGKWICWVPSDDITAAWKLTVDAIEAGRLGYKAAMQPSRHFEGRGEHVILIFTRDFQDSGDIADTLEKMEQCGLGSFCPNAIYKPVAYSLLHIQRHNKYGLSSYTKISQLRSIQQPESRA